MFEYFYTLIEREVNAKKEEAKRKEQKVKKETQLKGGHENVCIFI